jgi:hypothetical protein
MKEIHSYPISWLSERFGGKKGNQIGLRTGNNGQSSYKLLEGGR